MYLVRESAAGRERVSSPGVGPGLTLYLTEPARGLADLAALPLRKVEIKAADLVDKARSREMGASERSRHCAANLPSATIMRGRMAASCFLRNGSHSAISSGSGLRLPGGRHFRTFVM